MYQSKTNLDKITNKESWDVYVKIKTGLSHLPSVIN